MPSVNSNNFILQIPEVVSINRGVQSIITVSLHQDFLGNLVNIVNLNDVTVKIIDELGTAVKVLKKSDSTLSFGSGSNRGRLILSLSSTETKNLVEGDLSVDVTIQSGVKTINMPRLRVGQTIDGGESLPDGTVAGRFTIPAPIYSVKSFNYGTDLPGAGQVVINSSNPSGLTKIVLNNTDDLGKRNAYIETLLQKRYTEDGAELNLFVTNVNNTSEYAIFKVVASF